jgi:hypothetical protein
LAGRESFLCQHSFRAFVVEDLKLPSLPVIGAEVFIHLNWKSDALLDVHLTTSTFLDFLIHELVGYNLVVVMRQSAAIRKVGGKEEAPPIKEHAWNLHLKIKPHAAG